MKLKRQNGAKLVFDKWFRCNRQPLFVCGGVCSEDPPHKIFSGFAYKMIFWPPPLQKCEMAPINRTKTYKQRRALLRSIFFISALWVAGSKEVESKSGTWRSLLAWLFLNKIDGFSHNNTNCKINLSLAKKFLSIVHPPPLSHLCFSESFPDSSEMELQRMHSPAVPILHDLLSGIVQAVLQSTSSDFLVAASEALSHNFWTPGAVATR